MHRILWPRTAKWLGLGQKWKWFWKAWTMAFHALVVVKWVAAPPSGRKSTKRGNSPFWEFKNDEKTRFCALRAFFMRNFCKIFLASILGLQQSQYKFWILVQYSALVWLELLNSLEVVLKMDLGYYIWHSRPAWVNRPILQLPSHAWILNLSNTF